MLEVHAARDDHDNYHSMGVGEPMASEGILCKVSKFKECRMWMDFAYYICMLGHTIRRSLITLLVSLKLYNLTQSTRLIAGLFSYWYV